MSKSSQGAVGELTLKQIAEQFHPGRAADEDEDQGVVHRPRPSPFTDLYDERPDELPFKDTWLAKLHRKRVVHSDNDFLVAIAAASKSAVSGVGKTTLGIQLCRRFDQTEEGWSAREKATLDANEFTHDMLPNEERLPDGSAVLFDELQGTLSSTGADSRRSMADAVLNISKAIATMRYRQLSTVLVTQSTQWIDQRIRSLLDALILIQEPGKADVFDIYYNDLVPGQAYTERRGSLEWSELPPEDEDYAYMHVLKSSSADAGGAADEADDQTIPTSARDEKIKDMYDAGMPQTKIAEVWDLDQSYVSRIVNDKNSSKGGS